MQVSAKSLDGALFWVEKAETAFRQETGRTAFEEQGETACEGIRASKVLKNWIRKAGAGQSRASA
jgi:hypothetical protein